MEYSGCLAPSELVSGLDETLVLRVLPQTRDLVVLFVVESHGVRVARDDDVGPVAAALEQHVVVDLQRKRKERDQL